MEPTIEIANSDVPSFVCLRSVCSGDALADAASREIEILVHPNTGNAVADNTANALWLREKLLVNLELPQQIS
jgi:hypothetical protein